MLLEVVAFGSSAPEMIRRRSPAGFATRPRCRVHPSRKHPLGSAQLSRLRAQPRVPAYAGGGTSCKVPMALVREGRCRSKSVCVAYVLLRSVFVRAAAWHAGVNRRGRASE